MEAPWLKALLAGLLTWGFTALGAGLVLLLPRPNQRFLDGMLGLAGGAMLAASFFGLLQPAMESAQEAWGRLSWIPVALGFIGGALLVVLLDQYAVRLRLFQPLARSLQEGNPRLALFLVLAIAMHNLPEGLGLGVTFGAAALGLSEAITLGGALALALAIGLHNVPEGMAVAFPLRREGASPWTAWFYGQLSAVVEPLGALLGALLVEAVAPTLPYLLAVAAGVMVFVVVEEVIPSAQGNGNRRSVTWLALGGFLLIMALDATLG
ncbi:MAG: ZIP family metal transporter [Thermus sp.]|uniref:ZIP family metal transporter n=1 Tax=Thermus sp. TaxID=275 RepID=UPI0025D1EF48|nr:ZIP family metal transporter [Thermus sp.]MCS7218569.1 ZIP family metal transporter [Thermus sp.]